MRNRVVVITMTGAEVVTPVIKVHAFGYVLYVQLDSVIVLCIGKKGKSVGSSSSQVASSSGPSVYPCITCRSGLGMHTCVTGPASNNAHELLHAAITAGSGGVRYVVACHVYVVRCFTHRALYITLHTVCVTLYTCLYREQRSVSSHLSW